MQATASVGRHAVPAPPGRLGQGHGAHDDGPDARGPDARGPDARRQGPRRADRQPRGPRVGWNESVQGVSLGLGIEGTLDAVGRVLLSTKS